MIEQHYSHVKPEMFADALSGVTFDKEEPKALSKKTLNRRAKTAARDEKRFKEWAEGIHDVGVFSAKYSEIILLISSA